MLLRNQLEANTTLTPKIQADIEKEAKLIINEATQNAEAAPYVETSEFNNHVYSTN